VIPDAARLTEDAGHVMEASMQSHSGFMDNLPDIMKLDFGTIFFVVLLVSLLFLFMKYVCFKPIMKVIDDREAYIMCGAATLSEVVKLVEQRQAEYEISLRELRIKALEHRKALSMTASNTKQNLLDQAHEDSQRQLKAAIIELDIFKEGAKTELVTHVDALSDLLVKNLIRQA